MTDIVDHALVVIRTQQQANIAFDLIKSGKQSPDYLWDVLCTLGIDELPHFLRQLAKRIAQEQS